VADTIKKRPIAFVALVLVVLGFTACSNASPSVTNSGNTDGVYPNKIVVGGVASLSGVITTDFAPVFQGVQAYFNMVNSQGGVYGRKIDLAYKLDDASSPSQDIDQFRALIEDHVFAVVGVATPSFAGASVVVANGVPTFGMDINTQWNNAKNLFGENGSYLNFTAPQIEVAYLAQQVHATKAAVFAYSVAQSQEGCQGAINGLKEFGVQIVEQDINIPPPAVDLTADAERAKANGAQLIVSCLDASGNLVLSQALHQIGLGSVTQYWLDGYDQSYLNNPSDVPLMQGVYFMLQHAPFSVGQTDPAHYPGMALYLKELAKYYPGALPSEASLDGWLNADLFVKGLKLAGPNPTREKLIKAINSITSYTAGGILPPTNWTQAHSSSGMTCVAYVQVQNQQFVPRFGFDGSVFTCFSPAQKPNSPIIPIGEPGLPGLRSATG